MAENDDDVQHITEDLRLKGRDLYLASLLMPEQVRVVATLLFAYHVELSKIAEQVSEPVAGAIRLQWWADVMNGERAGEAQGHPLARALLELNGGENLATGFCAEMANAHEFDLFAEPMETRSMLEGYFGETRSIMFQTIALGTIGAGVGGMVHDQIDHTQLANASGHAGVSTGIVALLLNNAQRRARGQIWVPQDLLRAVGLSDEAYLTGTVSEIEPALNTLVDLGFEHHEKMAKALEQVPTALRSVFNLCALTPAYLKRASQSFANGSEEPKELGQVRTQWLLYRNRL